MTLTLVAVTIVLILETFLGFLRCLILFRYVTRMIFLKLLHLKRVNFFAAEF